ncbi:hypothetical protein EK21DRAFT_88723 [Setomelanomma holmii]|uniref:Uncharacterized protein n=1 Tax=Setomelanomma holmii TaxID=210430 RepID=A0A9P4LP81_9PLEO|nr:hypothetical protein EK21DRAFT_88723 [Setomelanomma holmii]
MAGGLPPLGVLSLRSAKACGGHFADSSEFSRGVLAVHWQPAQSQRIRREESAVEESAEHSTCRRLDRDTAMGVVCRLSSRATRSFDLLLRSISMECALLQALHPALRSSYLDIALAETPDLLAASTRPARVNSQRFARICEQSRTKPKRHAIHGSITLQATGIGARQASTPRPRAVRRGAHGHKVTALVRLAMQLRSGMPSLSVPPDSSIQVDIRDSPVI